jgi:ribosomal protein S18 acetylase RimI-like enzyme
MMGNDAAGYVVLTRRYSIDHGAFTAHIEDLYVRPCFRRGGVASALLSALMEDCRRRECKSVQVEVAHDHAPAVALYQKFGLGPFTDGRILLHGPTPDARGRDRPG